MSAEASPIFACSLPMQASAVVIGVGSALHAGLSLFRFGLLPEPRITEGLDQAGIEHEVPECICEPAAFDIARCPTNEASEPTRSRRASARWQVQQQLTSFIVVDAPTQRALRPGRRLVIQFPCNPWWFERIAVSEVTDFECFLAQPDGRITLVNLATVDAARLVPVSGGRGNRG